MLSFLSIFCITLFIYMFINDMLHPYTMVRRNTPGALVPIKYGVRSPYTFTSAAPQTYSIICIGSESCLGSIVGFARLPCFGTLRSVISAKVALGELLRLCHSWGGSSTLVEKAKTDRHDRARAGRCSRCFWVPKDLCRLERGAGFVRPRRG